MKTIDLAIQYVEQLRALAAEHAKKAEQHGAEYERLDELANRWKAAIEEDVESMNGQSSGRVTVP